MSSTTLLDRYLGAMLGLACGDAVGTTVEFSPRDSFAPLTSMVGGGPFRLAPGQWTDDTSMALCLAESLLERRGFDPKDQMARYLNWWQWGYLSSTGHCFDIGVTTREALQRFQRTGEPLSGSTEPQTAGNGSLMRLAPVVLYFHPSLELTVRYAAESSLTTHAASEAVDCCRLLACILNRALLGASTDDLVDGAIRWIAEPRVQELARGSYRRKTREQVRGTGYAVASLEAALWCVHSTNTYAEAVLAAANLGDDADTTAAIAGQIAGAVYGAQGIPSEWHQLLHMSDEIAGLASRLHDAAAGHHF